MAWQAHCDYPNATWWGPKRTDFDDAKADANAHNNEHNGHVATPVEVSD